jgi:hypothetical protein
MRSARLLGIVLAAAFAGAVLHFFGLEFQGGDVYPEYSSLRSDPLGAKLLYDTLARVPGIHVARNFATLDEIAPGSAVLMLGWDPAAAAGEADTLERAAARGLRIVVALRAGQDVKTDVFAKKWPLRLGTDADRGRVHRLYFTETGDWTATDRIGRKILAIEKPFGKGAIAIWAESDDFANQSTASMDRFESVSRAIGPAGEVVFDEQHFGMRESGTVIGLARRFRLTGFALGLGLCAALMLWRAGSPFPPLDQHPADRHSGRTAHAGLVTLLRRNIPPSQVAGLCWQEWLSSHRLEIAPELAGRAAAILSKSANPIDAIRDIQSALQSKGEI